MSQHQQQHHRRRLAAAVAASSLLGLLLGVQLGLYRCQVLSFGLVTVDHLRDDHGVPALPPQAPSPSLSDPSSSSIPGTEGRRLHDVLVYNAFPKAGSSTLSEWLMRSANVTEKFRFEFIWPELANETYGVEAVTMRYEAREQAKLVNYVMSRERPFGIRQHFYFIDFENVTGAGNMSVNPTYINFLRNPVDRFLSRFYFARSYPWTAVLHYRQYFPALEPQAVAGMSMRAWRRQTIQQCIHNGGECNPKPGDPVEFSIPYFCGNEPFCSRHKDERALARAKYNLDRYYTVVGLHEKRSRSYAVLKALLPLFFPEGTWKSWVHEQRNPTRPRNALNQAEKGKLKRMLSTEYDLYRYAQRRLARQDRALKEESSGQRR